MIELFFWQRGCAASRLAMVIVALFCSQQGRAHDPVMIDAVVAVSESAVTVTVRLSQATALACLGERRSLFRDPADLAKNMPRIATYLAQHTTLISGEAIRLRCESDAGALVAAAQPQTDPLVVVLSGDRRVVASRLSVCIDLLREFRQSAGVVINLHLDGGGAEAAHSVPSGTEVVWTVPTASHHPAVDSQGSAVGSFLDFIHLGFRHIMPEGIDHMLFVLGLFLLSPQLKPLLVQITAFTVAHSITLGLSMAGVVMLSGRVVEPLIALSIVVVAIENVFQRGVRPWRWLVVFAFGLVHGLGFACALKEIPLPNGGIVLPLLGFNLGVELGQVSVVLIAVAVTLWCRHRVWYPRYIAVPTSAMIAAIGLFWAIQRGLGFGIET